MKIGLHCIYAYDDNCMLGYRIKLTMDYIPTVNWSDLPLKNVDADTLENLIRPLDVQDMSRWYCLKSVNNNSFSIVYEEKTTQVSFPKKPLHLPR